MKNTFIHLTNYAINKNNAHFEYNVEADNADVGHKRSLQFVWDYIAKNGGDPEKVKHEIKNCIVKTFCMVQPLIAHVYKSCQPNDLANNKCFEILGFDILLDYKLKPWLLEVNQAPSFSTDTPFDKKVKAALLEDTFKLIHLDLEKKISCSKKKNVIQQARLVKFKALKKKLTAEERLQKKMKKMAKRDEYELNHLGDYELVYPDKEFELQYESYIRTATEQWDLFTGGKKKTHLLPIKDPIKKNPEVIRKPIDNRLLLMRPYKKIVAESKSFVVKTCNETPLKESTCADEIRLSQNLAQAFKNCMMKIKPERDLSHTFYKSIDPRVNKTEHKQRSEEERNRIGSAYGELHRINKSAIDKRTKLLVITSHKDTWKPTYGLYVMPKMMEFTDCPRAKQSKVPIIYKKLIPQHVIFKR